MASVGITNQAIGIWVVIGKENDTQNHRVHFGSFVLCYLWFVLYGGVVRYFYLCRY